MSIERINPKNTEIHQFSGKGEVFSHTTVLKAPSAFLDQVPYVVALIKLEEGPLVTSMLTDIEWKSEENIINGEKRQVCKPDVHIGMPVEMVTRRLCYSADPESSNIIYGPKFRPPLKTETNS